jgi:hypothetical protein
VRDRSRISIVSPAQQLNWNLLEFEVGRGRLMVPTRTSTSLTEHALVIGFTKSPAPRKAKVEMTMV